MIETRSDTMRPDYQRGLTPFDSNRAKEASKRGVAARLMRKAISQIDTMRGWRVGVQSIGADVHTFREAYRATVGQIALQAMEGDSRAFEALSKAAGLREPEPRAEQDSISLGQSSITISGPVAEAMLSRLAEMLSNKG